MAVNLNPLRFLLNDKDYRIVLIVLNNRVLEEFPFIKQIWPNALLKVFIDGAGNVMFDSCHKEQYIPDIVIGDFDSIRPQVLEYYRNKGTEIIYTPDQNATDFTKGLEQLTHRTQNIKFDAFLVFGAFGGRLDHLFANINTLYKIQPVIDKPVYCIADGSVCCLLKKGKTVIDIINDYRDNSCGLIPIGQPCHCVTTTGLKWNLDHEKLDFGDMISTSNTYQVEATEVSIETDNFLLWTSDFKTL